MLLGSFACEAAAVDEPLYKFIHWTHHWRGIDDAFYAGGLRFSHGAAVPSRIESRVVTQITERRERRGVLAFGRCRSVVPDSFHLR